jgi:hypothetical protein
MPCLSWHGMCYLVGWPWPVSVGRWAGTAVRCLPASLFQNPPAPAAAAVLAFCGHFPPHGYIRRFHLVPLALASSMALHSNQPRTVKAAEEEEAAQHLAPPPSLHRRPIQYICRLHIPTAWSTATESSRRG